MIVFQHGRSDWVDPAYPVTGPTFDWSTIEWVVIHYTAAINLPDGDMGEFAYQLPPYLRAVQREYLRRGYSIGYNAAVDWLGGDWELRGDTFKCAANADREDTIESPHDTGGDENARTFAILMLVDGQDAATPLAAAKVRGLVAQIRDHAPNAVVVLGHRDIDQTQCPGTGLYAQIKAGVFEPSDEPAPIPAPQPPPVTQEHDMIPAIAKTTDGAYLAQFSFRGPILTVGDTAQHDVTQAEVFGRGAGKAYDIVNRKVVTWAIDSPGSWAAVPETHTKAQVRALMTGT